MHWCEKLAILVASTSHGPGAGESATVSIPVHAVADRILGYETALLRIIVSIAVVVPAGAAVVLFAVVADFVAASETSV